MLWNSYILKLLRLETSTFSDATLSDINVVLCYVLTQYRSVKTVGRLFKKIQRLSSGYDKKVFIENTEMFGVFPE